MLATAREVRPRTTRHVGVTSLQSPLGSILRRMDLLEECERNWRLERGVTGDLLRAEAGEKYKSGWNCEHSIFVQSWRCLLAQGNHNRALLIRLRGGSGSFNVSTGPAARLQLDPNANQTETTISLESSGRKNGNNKTSKSAAKRSAARHGTGELQTIPGRFVPATELFVCIKHILHTILNPLSHFVLAVHARVYGFILRALRSTISGIGDIVSLYVDGMVAYKDAGSSRLSLYLWMRLLPLMIRENAL